MLVGIIDCDLFINKRTFLPNPEIMLLSSYHKKKGDIVHLLMDAKNINIYEKIYIYRNKTNEFNFPEELYSRSNVICRGLYFTNGIVAPIPKEIFACSPDKTIYDKYCNYWGNNPIKGVVTLNRAKYVSYRKGFAPLTGAGANCIYDYDLGTEEDLAGLMELYNKGYFKKLHFYYPIRCETIDLAIKWANAPFLVNLTKILYPYAVSWKDIFQIRKGKPKQSIVAYLTNKSRFTSSEDLEATTIEALDMILYCIINDINLQLKLTPKIKITQQFRLLKRISDWSCATIQPSFYDFCTKKDQTLIELFIKNNPQVKDWFFIKPHEYRNNGGIWINGRRAKN